MCPPGIISTCLIVGQASKAFLNEARCATRGQLAGVVVCHVMPSLVPRRLLPQASMELFQICVMRKAMAHGRYTNLYKPVLCTQIWLRFMPKYANHLLKMISPSNHHVFWSSFCRLGQEFFKPKRQRASISTNRKDAIHREDKQCGRLRSVKLKHVTCAVAASELGLHMALVLSSAQLQTHDRHHILDISTPNSSPREPVNHCLALPGGSRYGSGARRQDYAPLAAKMPCPQCQFR